MSAVTHAYIYDHSIIEYEVQASTLTVLCQVKHPSEEQDTSAWQSSMFAVTQFCLLRRRPWFYFHATYQLSQLRQGFSYDLSMLYSRLIRFHLDCFLRSRTPLWGGRHTRLKVTDGHRYPDYASWGDNCVNLPIERRSDSGVTVEQQQLNIEFFIPYLGRSDSGLTTAQQHSDSGAIAVR